MTAKRSKTFLSLTAIGLVLAAVVAWMVIGDRLWHNPRAVSDSEDAVVQPSVVPPAPPPAQPYSPGQKER